MSSVITVGNTHDLSIALEAVCQFYGDNWKRRIAFEVLSFCRWQVMAPPRNVGHDRYHMAVEDGKLRCAMGLNERPFLLDGVTDYGPRCVTDGATASEDAT